MNVTFSVELLTVNVKHFQTHLIVIFSVSFAIMRFAQVQYIAVRNSANILCGRPPDL